MIIDCDSCAARPAACGECVVGVLLRGQCGEDDGEDGGDGGGGGEGAELMPSGAPALSLDAPERRALDVLAEQGFVPRLRLVATTTRRTRPDGHPRESARDAG